MIVAALLARHTFFRAGSNKEGTEKSFEHPQFINNFNVKSKQQVSPIEKTSHLLHSHVN